MSSPLFTLYLWRVLFRRKLLIQTWPECLCSQSSSAVLALYFLHVYLDDETTRLTKDLKKPISQFLEVFSCLQIMLQNLKNDSYHYKIDCFIKNKEGPDCLSLDSLFVRLYGYQYWWQTEEMPMLMFAIQYTYSCRKDFWTFCCQFHMWEGSNFIETEWLMYCTYHSKGAV